MLKTMIIDPLGRRTIRDSSVNIILTHGVLSVRPNFSKSRKTKPFSLRRVITTDIGIVGLAKGIIGNRDNDVVKWTGFHLCQNSFYY